MSVAGLKLQLSSEKLRALVLARVEYHTRKSEFFATKIAEIAPELEAFDDDAESQGKFTNSRGPLDDFKTKGKHHKDKATYFSFVAENLIPDETYVLDENDLRRIEVISGNY